MFTPRQWRTTITTLADPHRAAVPVAPPVVALTGCTSHRVDTIEEWCDQIVGIDLQANGLFALDAVSR
jgi:hypothetical protein